MKRHFSNPSIKDVRIIGIDEFAIAKGHVYKKNVADLETGKLVYIAGDKGIASLDGFWKKLIRQGAEIKAVATDLSRAFILSVMKNSPNTVLVFDHFHVIKLINDTID